MTAPPPTILTQLISFHDTLLPRQSQSWPMHLHHFFQLDVLLTGKLTIRIEGHRSFQARPGEGWLISPLVRHGFEQRAACRFVSFKLQLAPIYYSQAAQQTWRHHTFPVYLRDMLIDQHAVRETAHTMIMGSLCVLEMLRQDTPSPHTDATPDTFRQTLGPLLERIEQDPQAFASVANMAEACCLSVDHFSRCFQRALGQTPRQYLLNARMRYAAAALLDDPQRPIKHIAQASGYATVHAFSAAFKRTLGRSPAAYRQTQPQM